MSETNRNQGEGNRDAARRFNERSESFAESGKVEEKASERRDVDAKKREELEEAEREGRSKAAEKDPAVSRDFERPTN